jgi:hypothetical protein
MIEMSRPIQFLAVVAMAAVLPEHEALAQSPASEPVSTTASDERAWSFSAHAYAYIQPDDDNYLQPTLAADRDRLHLEARYNYENLDTGSVWAGYNFSVGETVTLETTAMLGGVFGATTGVAPGYEASLSWRHLELYSEGEYVFDTNDSSNSFLYTWSELTWAPVDWSRFGFVVQRSKVYHTDRDIQRGFLVGLSSRRVDFTTYVFNPDRSPTVVLALGVRF